MILDTPLTVESLFQITAFHSSIEYRWDANFVFDGERHDFWEAVYVISGAVECTEDDKVYILRENNMLFHPPMAFHKIRSSAQTSPHLLILSFSVKGDLPDIMRKGVFSLSNDEALRYRTLFKRLYQMCITGETSDLGSRAAVMGFTSFLMDLALHSDVEPMLSVRSSAQIYHSAIQTMQNGLYDGLTLDQIADRCHISTSYLKTLFSQYAGVSPKRYYSEMRFHEAVRLMKTGALISEVSEKMGFSSPNYFSVFIKKWTGQSPAVFLHRIRKNSDV